MSAVDDLLVGGVLHDDSDGSAMNFPAIHGSNRQRKVQEERIRHD